MTRALQSRSIAHSAFVANLSPGQRAVFVREAARRAVRVEERQAHRLARALFDGARASELVEIGGGETRARRVHLDARGLELVGEGDGDRVEGRLGRDVADALDRPI